jgi:hypothetical protein
MRACTATRGPKLKFISKSKQGCAREPWHSVLRQTQGHMLARHPCVDKGESIYASVSVVGEDIIKHPREQGHPTCMCARVLSLQQGFVHT